MKAKEYAEYLVGKMCLNDCTDKNIEKAKQYALIVIDELIKRENSLLGLSNKCSSTWYDMVKNEVNLL